jgi:guanine deaminase
LVCEDGKSSGVFEHLPNKYKDFPLKDYGDALILPGLVDLHVHAPQYAIRGYGMDMELLEWLEKNAFPEESRYGNVEYAKTQYKFFAEELKRSATSRACIFSTVHNEATISLMDQLEQTGLRCKVGKVNMDRNAPENLVEKSARESIIATREWLDIVVARFKNTQPIITPRFLPSCTDELMEALGIIAREYGVPVQSHLSETKAEIVWVKRLAPEAKNYGDAYRRRGLFGGDTPTVMAHCVWCSDSETDLILERGVLMAHCPQSNMNVSSGIAPIRRYLQKGVKIGIGSDVAGGAHLSIFRAMADAIQVSKL